MDWRIKETPWSNPSVPLILPSGLHKLNEHGEEIQMTVPDSDSGIVLRGQGKAQVNIWCWPVGSGEVYGYRMDKSMPAEVRAGPGAAQAAGAASRVASATDRQGSREARGA